MASECHQYCCRRDSGSPRFWYCVAGPRIFHLLAHQHAPPCRQGVGPSDPFWAHAHSAAPPVACLSPPSPSPHPPALPVFGRPSARGTANLPPTCIYNLDARPPHLTSPLPSPSKALASANHPITSNRHSLLSFATDDVFSSLSRFIIALFGDSESTQLARFARDLAINFLVVAEEISRLPHRSCLLQQDPFLTPTLPTTYRGDGPHHSA